MKKLLAILLALVMVFGVVACGAKSEPAPAEPVPEVKEEKEEQAPAESAPVAEERENVIIEFSGVESDWRDEWDSVKEKFETEYPEMPCPKHT